MSLLTMNTSLILGHDRIDTDHQKLFDLIEQLASAMNTGKDKRACVRVCSELLGYTRTHFAMEEALMSHHGYAQAAAHQAEHDKFVARLDGFRQMLDAGSVVLSIEILTFLLDWLRSHILLTDKALVATLPRLADDPAPMQHAFANESSWALGNRVNVKV